MDTKQADALRRRAAEAAAGRVEEVFAEAGTEIYRESELAAEALLLALQLACGPREAARALSYCSPRYWDR